MRPTLSKEAYAVLLLHAARYPHCAVGGVLLGAVEDREAHVRRAIPCFHHALTGPAVETAMAVVRSLQAGIGRLPPSLSPCGLQIESHAEEEGSEVVGCYYAPAGERDASVPAPYAKFMERIVSSRPGSVALLVRRARRRRPAPRLTSRVPCPAAQRRAAGQEGERSPAGRGDRWGKGPRPPLPDPASAAQALRREGDKFVSDHASAIVVDEGAVEAADALCCEGGTDEVVDWEMHLENPAADWRNPTLLSRLE